MIKFNSLEDIKKYYNKNTKTYEFIEDGIRLDVEFAFDLEINGNINARDIKAQYINACDIKELDIKAHNIKARDINAYDIKARDITYHAVCFAYQDIECSSIKGRRVNAKHFVLDGKIKIIEKERRNRKCL